MDAGQGCRSKQVYLSKAEAKRVARLMSRRHREGLHLYRCPDCGYYHVGHIVPAWQRTRSIPSPERGITEGLYVTNRGGSARSIPA